MRRIWNSDLLVSWGSLLLNLTSAAVILPLALIALQPVESALWLLFTLIANLSVMVSFGLQGTFTRIIAYAMGGAEVEQFSDSEKLKDSLGNEPNAEALHRVTSTLCALGAALASGAALLFTVGGAAASANLIGSLARPEIGWAALAVTSVAAVLGVWGQIHAAYLLGINRVLSLRRWEFLTTLGQVTSMLTVVLVNGGFLALVVVTNFWVIFRTIRNAYLARRYDVTGEFKSAKPTFDSDVLRAAWPAQWRLGVSVFFSFGVVQLSGVAAAQLGSPNDVASYLFHLRLISAVNNLSLPPFYNRIPIFSQYMAGHRFDLLRDLAQRRMALAYQSFAVAFVGFGVAGQWFIETFTQVEFAFQSTLWTVFGLAFFVERMAGMHSQLYMLTNRVMYQLNVASGAIYISLAVLLIGQMGMIAFPLSYLIGLTIAFAPFIMKQTYRIFALQIPGFELRTSAPPFFAILIYGLIAAAI